MFTPESIDHLVFRVADLVTTERFYTAVLGKPIQHTDDSLLYMIGSTRLFFTIADRGKAAYDKEQTGLNHLAFTIPTMDDLQTIVSQLNLASIPNSGIKLDHYGSKEFIWLDDPDGLRIEFYLRGL